MARVSRQFASSTGSPRAVLGAAGLALLLWGAASAVLADGDDFFTFRSKSFGADGSRNVVKNGFFGAVKDDAGNYLKDAVLTIAVNVRTADGSQRITYNSYTNVVGRYRTLDAASVAADLLQVNADVQPQDVELLGVEKAGYVQLRRLDRSRRGQGGVREIDFVMRRAAPEHR
jgi:hypothetical protein